jgi:hypothetical protein
MEGRTDQRFAHATAPVALLVLVVAAVGWRLPATVGASSTGHSTKVSLVDSNCYAKGQARPARIVLACGDGNAVAEHLTWQKWTGQSAIGRGDLRGNDCVPDCAQGTFHNYPARFTLSETVVAAGRNYFTRVTIRFTAKAPSAKRVETVKDCFDSPPSPYVPRCPSDLQGAS